MLTRGEHVFAVRVCIKSAWSCKRRICTICTSNNHHAKTSLKDLTFKAHKEYVGMGIAIEKHANKII